MLDKIKKNIDLDNPFRLFYHLIKAIIANFYYGFPSKNMTIIGVTGTDGKTTTCNIIAAGLKRSGKKIFMFTTVNIIIGNKEYVNNSRMTSPDPFKLQKYLFLAKKKGCNIAIIETASHGIKMHRIWGIQYDILLLTNITQDHLDLHKTMNDYVETKLSIFKNLIGYNRKKGVKKVGIINNESDYSKLFKDETYDVLYNYGTSIDSNIRAKNIKYNINGSSFIIELPGNKIKIKTDLIGYFNVYNILGAVCVFISLNINIEKIPDMITEIKRVPGRMEEVKNNEGFKIFIDYAHTSNALEKTLTTIQKIKGNGNIITVFGATGDRDKTKRPIMGKIVSKLSDKVILTQDDDYTENTREIIKDVLPGIKRKQGEDFWIIPNRKIAIRTALLMGNKDDIILIVGKGDEHSLITNKGSIPWHDKKIVNNILKSIDEYKE